MLVFEERGKPEYPEKNLSEQSREPTNSAHIWRRVRNWTQDTLVEGERSHHCANPAPRWRCNVLYIFLRIPLPLPCKDYFLFAMVPPLHPFGDSNLVPYFLLLCILWLFLFLWFSITFLQGSDEYFLGFLHQGKKISCTPVWNFHNQIVLRALDQ